MPRNDVVLLDSLVDKARRQLGESWDDAELFELFCFNEVLKDFDLSFEELESGWTDGTNDGGIDGFFLFVDGHLATDDEVQAAKWEPSIRLCLFTVRRSDSFQQDPLNSLLTTVRELFDLTKPDGALTYPYSDEILVQRQLFSRLLVSLADRRPLLTIEVHYCSRGDTATLADNLITRARQLKGAFTDLFSGVDADVSFDGATELLELARKQRTYSLRLRFTENYISREGQNYLVLATLSDYYRFVTDENGRLRRYLFESNVRDYLGSVQVNRDIRATLEGSATAVDEDFWWLNNGVTVLATHATVVGKELSLENVQIVNGLQTTETIYNYMVRRPDVTDTRAILVKILFSGDEATRAKIVKAANYQNAVELSSLRGLDKIQRDIEHFLADHDWYYDRRKNEYKNLGSLRIELFRCHTWPPQSEP